MGKEHPHIGISFEEAFKDMGIYDDCVKMALEMIDAEEQNMKIDSGQKKSNKKSVFPRHAYQY